MTDWTVNKRGWFSEKSDIEIQSFPTSCDECQAYASRLKCDILFLEFIWRSRQRNGSECSTNGEWNKTGSFFRMQTRERIESMNGFRQCYTLMNCTWWLDDRWVGVSCVRTNIEWTNILGRPKIFIAFSGQSCFGELFRRSICFVLTFFLWPGRCLYLLSIRGMCWGVVWCGGLKGFCNELIESLWAIRAILVHLFWECFWHFCFSRIDFDCMAWFKEPRCGECRVECT